MPKHTILSGNTRSLAAEQLRRLDRLRRRRLPAEDLVSPEFAKELCEVAQQVGRRVGALISREGGVEEIVVGSREILYLPDLGRYRLGVGRLRRLRLVFSDLSKKEDAELPQDILTDLEKLRLDAVVGVKFSNGRLSYAAAHLSAAEPYRVLKGDLNKLDLDFKVLVEELEGELSNSQAKLHKVGKTRALLVGVYDRQRKDCESSMLELKELARTAGVEIADSIIQKRTIDPRTLLGKGKLEEVMLQCLRLEADMLIFDTELRPAQWRVITNATEMKVLDRSMLILDIFAQRARSSDGRLQVELAQLRYNLPRLVEKDAGLSRLSGGIGGRGPGETKLEIGRRRIRDRIALLEKKISELSRQRGQRRTRRVEGGSKHVAIVGYTNVGKSTLFNTLTGSEVLVENKLFATLDPAQRRFAVPSPAKEDQPPVWQEIILSDTVGFIRDLPQELKSAFRATLEELEQASLLLEVLDASDPEIEQHMLAVKGVLEEMQLADLPLIFVLNKIDKVSAERVKHLQLMFDAVAVSATKGIGLDTLRSRVGHQLFN